MSACTRAEYQNYLNNNPYIDTKSQEEYSEFKHQEESRPLWKRTEEKFFDTIGKMLPKKHRVFVDYLHLAFIVSRCRVSYHLNDSKTVKVVSGLALGVFFCHQSVESFLEASYVLACIAIMQQRNLR
jgi:hypothetical protein